MLLNKKVIRLNIVLKELVITVSAQLLKNMFESEKGIFIIF